MGWATDNAARLARAYDWFDGNPPAFDWTHDPGFVSLRARRIIRRANFAWWQYALRCRFHPNQIPTEWRPAS